MEESGIVPHVAPDAEATGSTPPLSMVTLATTSTETMMTTNRLIMLPPAHRTSCDPRASLGEDKTVVNAGPWTWAAVRRPARVSLSDTPVFRRPPDPDYQT